MKSKSESGHRERQDWLIVLLILLLGFLCVIVAAQWALRFSPSWKLNTDMGSNIDPNSSFLTDKPVGFVEPVDAAILTKPAWVKVFLTPGAKFVTGTPPPAGQVNNVATQQTTILPATNTLAVTSTLPAGTSTIASTNTFVWLPLPATKTPKPNPPADTPTNTSPPPSANLQLTNTDNADLYLVSSVRRFTVTVSNLLGPSDVIGASISDTFSGPIFGVPTWTCSASNAVCPLANGSGPITASVDLPLNSSITYTIDITTTNAGGDLVNTALINLPTGYLGPTPLSVVDTDQELTSVAFGSGPYPAIGETKDTATNAIPSNSSVTLQFSTPLIVGAGNYLVYYEMAAASGILMDQVIIEVSDGYNWYTIFNWGGGGADTNSNLNTTLIGGTEDDNRDIAAALLFNSTGVIINVDGVIPNGTYPYIRITAPGGDSGDGCDVDAIDIMP